MKHKRKKQPSPSKGNGAWAKLERSIARGPIRANAKKVVVRRKEGSWRARVVAPYERHIVVSDKRKEAIAAAKVFLSQRGGGVIYAYGRGVPERIRV